MELRVKDILERSIEDFIKRGCPITSEYLYKKYDFGIKPAMIRRELNDLDRAGYLTQTHPSSGRVPTHKAYRMFVRSLLDRGVEVERPKETQEIVEEFVARRMQIAIEALANYLKLLSVVYEPEERMIYGSGLQMLFDTLEVDTKYGLLRVVRDFERLPARLESDPEWWTEEEKWPQVFVGESPITRSRDLAVIVEKVVVYGGPMLLVTIGPERMDYRKSLGFFQSFEDALEEL